MKKVLGFLAVVMTIVSLTSLTVAIAEFKFDKEMHDFGTIPLNKPASYDFSFKNVGDEPIVVKDVKPSCGCSVAKFPTTPIKPGESSTISVTYNAATKGPFTKQFTVMSNTKTPVKTLTIKGIVE